MMVIATECRKGAARVKFENPLDVRVMAIDGTWCRDCQLIDVSETGAQIRLIGPAVNDTEFFLLLTNFCIPDVYKKMGRRHADGSFIPQRFYRSKTFGAA